MRTYALMFSGLVLLSGCTHSIRNSASDAAFKKPEVIKIAALPVDAMGAKSDITFAVAGEFLKAGWKVVDRSVINRVMEEQQFQATGAVEKNAVKIGKMTGANLVTTGTYADSPHRYLYLRMIDVETGEIVATTSCFGDDGLGACAAKEIVRLVNGK